MMYFELSNFTKWLLIKICNNFKTLTWLCSIHLMIGILFDDVLLINVRAISNMTGVRLTE